MKSRALLLTIPFAMMLTACQPATVELTEEQKAEIAGELTQFMDGFVSSIREWDVEHMLTHFQRGEELTFTQDGIVTRSWDGFADLKRTTWGGFTSAERFDYDPIIQVLAADVGVVTWSFDIALAPTTGDVVNGHGTVTAVCSKQNGEWKIVTGAEYFAPVESP
jgi:hypothetical protein